MLKNDFFRILIFLLLLFSFSIASVSSSPGKSATFSVEQNAENFKGMISECTSLFSFALVFVFFRNLALKPKLFSPPLDKDLAQIFANGADIYFNDDLSPPQV